MWVLPAVLVAALVVTLHGTRARALGTGVQTGMKAPGFRLATLGGGSLSLASLRGQAVVLDFFTSWCVACRAEAPALEQLAVQGRGRIAVVGVDMTVSEPSVSAVRAFARTYGLTFPIVLDRSGQVSDMYQVQSIPTVVFVDGAGIVRGVESGALSYGQIVAGIAPYVSGPA